MTCERARTWIPDLLDGSLSAARQVILEAHLAGCAECRAERDTMRAMWEGLAVLPSHEPPVTLRATIWQRIDAQEPVPVPESRRTLAQALFMPKLWLRVAAAAAGIALIVVLSQTSVPGRFRAAGWASWFGLTAQNQKQDVSVTGSATLVGSAEATGLTPAVRVRLRLSAQPAAITLVLVGPDGDIARRTSVVRTPEAELGFPVPVDAPAPTGVRVEWRGAGGAVKTLVLPLRPQ